MLVVGILNKESYGESHTGVFKIKCQADGMLTRHKSGLEICRQSEAAGREFQNSLTSLRKRRDRFRT